MAPERTLHTLKERERKREIIVFIAFSSRYSFSVASSQCRVVFLKCREKLIIILHYVGLKINPLTNKIKYLFKSFKL